MNVYVMPGKYVDVTDVTQVELSPDVIKGLIDFAQTHRCYALQLNTTDFELIKLLEYELGFIRNIYWLDKSRQVWDTVCARIWGIGPNDIQETQFGAVASLSSVDVQKQRLIPLSCINGVNHYVSLSAPLDARLSTVYEALRKFNLFSYGYACNQLWDTHEAKIPSDLMALLTRLNVAVWQDTSVIFNDNVISFGVLPELNAVMFNCPAFTTDLGFDKTVAFTNCIYPSKFVQPLKIANGLVLLSNVGDLYKSLVIEGADGGAMYVNVDLKYASRLAMKPKCEPIRFPVGFHQSKPVTTVYVTERRQ